MAEIKSSNEMALKANERKNKEGICRRIFVEHFISPLETEVGRDERRRLSSPGLQVIHQFCGDIIKTMINDQTF